jgi:hypothetical protein
MVCLEVRRGSPFIALASRLSATTVIRRLGMHGGFCPKKLETRGGRERPAGPT